MARRAALLLSIALVLGGCMKQDEPVAATCLAGPAPLARALQRAPQTVTLADGARLSTCVSRARSDGELQTVGSSLATVGDELATLAPHDRTAALRLGYLIGATRRGVAASPGLAEQIGRHLERATQLQGASAATRAALARGLRAGEAGG